MRFNNILSQTKDYVILPEDKLTIIVFKTKGSLYSRYVLEAFLFSVVYYKDVLELQVPVSERLEDLNKILIASVSRNEHFMLFIAYSQLYPYLGVGNSDLVFEVSISWMTYWNQQVVTIMMQVKFFD